MSSRTRLCSRTGPLPGPTEALPFLVGSTCVLFLRVTCYHPPFNGHILSHSRCVNTLNHLPSGSTLGVSWRWFCITLDQSLNLILRCGRQFYFVQFWAQKRNISMLSAWLISPKKTQEAKNCWKVLSTSWAQQAKVIYQPLQPPFGLDEAGAQPGPHLVFSAASCYPPPPALAGQKVGKCRLKTDLYCFRLALTWHPWADPPQCSRFGDVSLSWFLSMY